MPSAPLPLAEALAALIACLEGILAALGGGGRLGATLIGQIVEGLRKIDRPIARIAASTDAPLADAPLADAPRTGARRTGAPHSDAANPSRTAPPSPRRRPRPAPAASRPPPRAGPRNRPGRCGRRASISLR